MAIYYLPTRSPRLCSPPRAPVVHDAKCVGEAKLLDLPAEVLDEFLFRTADRFFNNQAA